MGQPKAVAQVAGRPLIEHLLSPPVLRGMAEVVVVVGHYRRLIEPVVERLGFSCVWNPDPDRGRTGSVQVGLKALRKDVAAVFIQPVDCPLIRPETYQALVEGLTDADVAVPVHEGRRGHPPLVAARLVPNILQAPADKPLREILGAAGVRRCLVRVDDPGVLLNVDRPEDAANLEAVHRLWHRP